MNRLEAAGVVFVFAVIGALGLWLGLSRLWGRRRIPERARSAELTVPGVAGKVVFRLTELGRRRLLALGLTASEIDRYWKKLSGDPPETVLTGWLEDWELEPTKPERGDDPWPNMPIVKATPIFDHSPPRPWARG